MKGTTAYALIWIACSAAIAVSVYVTHNADPLWAFLIPACVSFTSRD